MNLKFIGTGGIANKNCNTSIMIDDILFDIGNGVFAQLDKYNISLEKINYLVLSHFHGDHISDITVFLMARIYRGFSNSLTIIGPKGTKEKVRQLFVLLYGDGIKDYSNIEEKYNVNYIEIENQEEVLINNKILKAYKLEHKNCIEEQGYTYDNKVAYLLDTTICDNYYKALDNANLIVTDVTFLESNEAHIGLNDILKVSKDYKDKKFYAVHRSNYEYENKDNLIFPEDGDKLEI